jgi:hypothetical protein
VMPLRTLKRNSPIGFCVQKAEKVSHLDFFGEGHETAVSSDAIALNLAAQHSTG